MAASVAVEVYSEVQLEEYILTIVVLDEKL